MTEVLRFRVEKLIRDKLPEIMRAAGLRVFDRTLDTPEFIESLKAKLTEETAEVVAAGTRQEVLEELADVMEVVLALAECHDFTIADLEAKRISKHDARGGFSARTYNTAVEATQDCAALSHYLSQPGRYPRI